MIESSYNILFVSTLSKMDKSSLIRNFTKKYGKQYGKLPLIPHPMVLDTR